MIKHKRTGRTRYRPLKRAFRNPVMILQVEIKGFVSEFSGGAGADGGIRTYWRDARLEDMTIGQGDSDE